MQRITSQKITRILAKFYTYRIDIGSIDDQSLNWTNRNLVLELSNNIIG